MDYQPLNFNVFKKFIQFQQKFLFGLPGSSLVENFPGVFANLKFEI